MVSNTKTEYGTNGVDKMNKNDTFIKHIEKHLKNMTPEQRGHGKVMCKICGKTIDEIYEEEK